MGENQGKRTAVLRFRFIWKTKAYSAMCHLSAGPETLIGLGKVMVNFDEAHTVYAELNSMRTEMANMRDNMRSMRDEIRALSTTVLRMDGSVQSMARELGAISGLLAEQSPPPP
jgi:hypothetical protein